MLIPVADLSARFAVKANGVLHVGAHDAEEAEDYRRHHWGPVIWVEMLPDKAAALRRNFKGDPDNPVIEAACWDRDGDAVELFRADNGQSSSLLQPRSHLTAHPGIAFSDGGQMQTSRLDTILPAEARFDFINVDIQGAELRALIGLGDWLDRVTWAYLEVNSRELYRGCALLPDIDRFMAARGFVRLTLRMTAHGWGDALYVNRRKVAGARLLRLRGTALVYDFFYDAGAAARRAAARLKRSFRL